MGTINTLIERLDSVSNKLILDGSDIDVNILSKVVNDFNTEDLDLSKLEIDPGKNPYGRNILFNNGKVEVVMLTWAEGSVCDVHDHGNSCGVVKVVKGHISNIIYSLNPVTGEPVHQEERYVMNQVFFEVPKGCWHQMKNNQEENRAFTLHVYAPPIEDMKVYDSEKKQLVTVSDDCGAWLTEPEKFKGITELKS